MDENLVKTFLRQNEWWSTKKVPIELKQEFIRPKVNEILEYLELDRIIILLGARRVGKTTIMHQLIDRLIMKNINPGNILYLRLDDPVINKFPLTEIIETYRHYKMPDSTIYLFLDEVQHMPEWDLWLKTVYDQKENIKIIASGSAAVQLKKQSESLYGRSLEFIIHPFSFFEFVLYMQEDEKKIMELRAKINLSELDFNVNAAELIELENRILPHLNRYLVRGGFPEIFNIHNLTKSFYVLRDDVMNKAIYHDIVTLFKIKEPQMVESLLIYLAANSAKILNKDELSKDLGIPKPTIYTYLDYLRRAFLSGSARNYSKSVKKMLRTREKWYVTDAGIMNMLNYKDDTLLSEGTYLGYLVETIVFNHILTFAEMQNYKLAYWRDKSKAEVDIVLDMQKHLIPIEVKYQSKIRNADIKGILKFMDKFSVTKGIVVTRNVFKTEYFGEKEIIFVPLWVLLLTL